MTLASYEDRQHVDHPWTGCIPAHWGYGPYKRQIDIQNGRDHKEVESKDGYPVIGSGGAFTFATDIVHNGEAVLLGRKGTIDKPLYINGPFWAVDTMYWGKIRPDAYGRFAYYVALTIPFGYYSTNTALPSMTKTDLGRHAVPIPPRDEQIAIAAFLDHETGRIDDLIAEQERLITLLDEKRQAVIIHIMTKGLDPDVEMKDSGIEWLGEVPAHWQVCNLSYHYRVELGKMLDEKTITSDHLHPYLRNVDVQWSGVNTTDLPMMTINPEDHHRYELQPGDLLVCEGGDVGRCCIWQGSERPVFYQKALHRLRPHDPDSCSVSYLQYAFKAAHSSDAFTRGEVKATIHHLPAEKLRKHRFPFPPKGEQEGIALYLDNVAGGFDALSKASSEVILLLKERRSALISAAVTGNIDVRNHPAAVAALNENKD